MDPLLQDVRWAMRSLWRRRGMLCVSIAALALSVGANTAVFSLVRSVYLAPMPGVAAGALVRIYTGSSSANSVDPRRYGRSSRPELQDYESRTDVFSAIAAAAPFGGELGIDANGGRFNGALVSGNYFTMLGIHPVLGRLLVPGDDRVRGASAVAVISDAFWRARYDRSPSAVGTAIVLNGHSFTIVGVAPPDFRGTSFAAAPDLWVPISAQAEAYGTPWVVDYRDARLFTALGRLRRGATVGNAQARLDVVSAELQHQHPETNAGRVARVEQARTLAGSYERTRYGLDHLIGLLAAVVVLIHVVVCANVGTLLAARVSERRKEIAVRLALGTSQLRLVRQLMAESLLLMSAGCVIGVLLARWGIAALRLIPFLRSAPVSLDLPVLVFVVGLGLLTGVLCGIAPAWQTADANLAGELREAAPTAPPQHARIRSGLIVIQLALALVVVTGATVLLRSLQALLSADPGYELAHVLVGRVSLLHMAGFEPNSMLQYDQLLHRLRAVPGVVSVSSANHEMLTGTDSRIVTTIPGYSPAEGEDMHIGYDAVGPGYFATLGIPILHGRGLTWNDASGTPSRVVINEAMAHRYWPDGDPIGRFIERAGVRMEIVGIVPNVAFAGIRSAPIARYYAAVRQYTSQGMSYAPMQQVLYVRVAGDPATMTQALRQAMRDAAPELRAVEFRSLADDRDVDIRPTRLVARFVGAFSILALVLVAMGLYGMIAFAVTQRTREIGLRVALGATRERILILMLGGVVRVLALGMLLGVPVALATRRLAAGFVFGVGTGDPANFLYGGAVLSVVALIAAIVPAVRAARIDPLIALRSE